MYVCQFKKLKLLRISVKKIYETYLLNSAYALPNIFVFVSDRYLRSMREKGVMTGTWDLPNNFLAFTTFFAIKPLKWKKKKTRFFISKHIVNVMNKSYPNTTNNCTRNTAIRPEWDSNPRPPAYQPLSHFTSKLSKNFFYFLIPDVWTRYFDEKEEATS